MSIDPVTTDANTGSSFNRYAYANNSPYKYVDPDGRHPALLVGVKVSDVIISGAEIYAAVQTGGAAAAVPIIAQNLALNVIPGGKTGGAILKHVADIPGVKKVISRIGESAKLIKEAEKSGKNQQVQRGIDDLTDKLKAGNTNPGIGTKGFDGISEARHKDGGRVYFQEKADSIEILGKSGKDNQSKVIKEVLETFK